MFVIFQAAHSYIHAAALVAEYLKRRGRNTCVKKLPLCEFFCFLHVAKRSFSILRTWRCIHFLINCYIIRTQTLSFMLSRHIYVGLYPEGCEAFRYVSPNIVPDENVMKNDEGLINEQRYSTVK